MITIGTYDFISRLSDARTFAPSSRVDRDNALVRITWTGTRLEFSAYATSYGAVATWKPENGDNTGGADAPWEILLPNTKVKKIIDTFKLTGERTQHAPLDIDVDFRTLRIRRAGLADEGVPAMSYGYTSEIEHNPPTVTEVFSNLGAPRITDPDLRADPPVMIGIGAAMKRSGMQIRFDPYEAGVRATIGDLTIFWRRPVDPDVAQAAADEAAIVEEAMSHLVSA